MTSNVQQNHPSAPTADIGYAAPHGARNAHFGGQPDLVALFVVVTGVFGMAIGVVLFLRLSIREGMAKGAGFGAASHGAGTARSYELGQQEGVVASLVMMLSGVLMVLVSPLVARMMF